MCYKLDANVGGIHIRKLSKVLAGKISQLSGQTQRKMQAIVSEYDQEIQTQCKRIDKAIKAIELKQEQMQFKFEYMIDQLIHTADSDEVIDCEVESPPHGDPDDDLPGKPPFLHLCILNSA